MWVQVIVIYIYIPTVIIIDDNIWERVLLNSLNHFAHFDLHIFHNSDLLSH